VKIYIVTDMEGIGGIVSESQITPSGGSAYEEARKWLTLEVNAAVEGAIAGGAKEVIVLDGHGANAGRNIIYELLHESARCIQGTPWPEYLPKLDSSFDGLFQIGAHAMAGTPSAVLDHTMSAESCVRMLLNGEQVGEIGLCAALAGHYGVPFVLISGDDKACQEAASLVPGIEAVVTKIGITRNCAEIVPLPTVLSTLRSKAEAAVRKIGMGTVKPIRLQSPVSLQIEYLQTSALQAVSERGGVRKTSSRTIVYEGKDIVEVLAQSFGHQ
jgi:D-amino peptidase